MKEFRTSDIKVAAYLLSRDILLQVIPNENRPGKAVFVAPATDEIDRAVAAFNADQPVPVQSFCNNLECIKDRVMQVVRTRGGAR